MYIFSAILFFFFFKNIQFRIDRKTKHNFVYLFYVIRIHFIFVIYFDNNYLTSWNPYV